jgi:putative ABC transport system substrate-binding protein
MKARAAALVLVALTLLRALAFLLAPLAAEAQQAGKVYRIGFLSDVAPGPSERFWREALRQVGYVEGQNAVLHFRWASERPEALPRLATELVEAKVDVILTGSTPPALAAKQVTRTIPIITISADPIGTGLVTSLARPEGNVTGVFLPLNDLAAKRLQLLKEAVPSLDSVAIIWNPANPTARLQGESTEAAARTLGIATHSVELRSASDVEAAFARVVARRVRGFIVMQDPITLRAAAGAARLAAKHSLPGSYTYRDFTDAGGLMSYGPNRRANFDVVALYADKVLKGAKPADLPMEQPTKFELVINLKTAKALGLTIPPPLLLRADQVIE